MNWTIMETGQGPEWSGFDSLYNPRHKYRWPLLIVGLTLIVGHYVLMSFVGSMMYGYVSAEDVEGSAWWGFKFLVLPGAAMLGYAGWFCRKYLHQRWILEATPALPEHSPARLSLARPRHWLIAQCAEWCERSTLFYFVFHFTVGNVAEVLDFDLEDRGGQWVWSVPITSIARVEISATAQWVPARPGLVGDNPVSGDEVQAFLFMDNGSRRVIATEHGGRESLSKLTHSIRTWLDRQRQAERITGETPPIARLEPADGFNI
jgi:hypothetical protein